MIQITVISVGKIKEKYFLSAIEEYEKRLKRYASLNLIELKDEAVPESLSDAQKLAVLKKEGDKILVPEILMGAIGLQMMLIGRVTLSVHIPGVPLIGIGGNAVNPPMNKNAQFFLRKPLGNRSIHQRAPLRLVGTFFDHPINHGKDLPLFVGIKHADHSLTVRPQHT